MGKGGKNTERENFNCLLGKIIQNIPCSPFQFKVLVGNSKRADALAQAHLLSAPNHQLQNLSNTPVVPKMCCCENENKQPQEQRTKRPTPHFPTAASQVQLEQHKHGAEQEAGSSLQSRILQSKLSSWWRPSNYEIIRNSKNSIRNKHLLRCLNMCNRFGSGSHVAYMLHITGCHVWLRESHSYWAELTRRKTRGQIILHTYFSMWKAVSQSPHNQLLPTHSLRRVFTEF